MKVAPKNGGKFIFFFTTAGLALGLAVGVVKSIHLGVFPAVLSFLCVIAFQWFIFKKGQSSSWAQAHAWAQSNVDIAIEVSNIARANAQAVANSYSLAISQANATANNSLTVQLSDGKLVPISVPAMPDSHLAINGGSEMGLVREYADIMQEIRLREASTLIEAVHVEADQGDFALSAIPLVGLPVQKDFGRVLKVLLALPRRTRI